MKTKTMKHEIHNLKKKLFKHVIEGTILQLKHSL